MGIWKPIDKGQELDSRKALTYLWINWRIVGIHPTTNYKMLYYIYSMLASIISAIGLPVTLIVQLFYLDGWDELIENLYLNVTLTVASLKHFTLLLNRHQLLNINDYLKKLDARCNGHDDERKHILSAIRLCRLLFVIFMILYSLTSGGFAYIGFTTRRLVYNGWYPKIFSNPENNLTLALIYQNWAVLSFFVFQNVNNDVYPQAYIALVTAHFRSLSTRIERIGKDATKSQQENLRELLLCVQDHKNILKVLDCIRPVISKTITQQFIVTAFVLCLTAVKIIMFEVDVAQLLFTTSYLFAVLIEIFPCCWFVNILLEEDKALTVALYSCNWYEQNIHFRRILIIFMQRTQKSNTITAGNLAPITLQSFVGIIRFSFSMFTVLSKMNIKNVK